MIITDLFSHKIHSSGDDWSQKLIDIASVFAEFDGMPYDRAIIEERFKQISPRASIVARDPSKYRDEISAYPAYLGLYRLELKDNQWILRLGETAKRIHTGSWFKYFDGVAQLSSDIVQEIAEDHHIAGSRLTNFYEDTEMDELISDNKDIVFKYPLRERGSLTDNTFSANYNVKKMTDPEVTRIKRQKSNLRHKILLSQLDEHLRKLGAKPMDNEHIDLYAELPNDGSFLFEIKSANAENLLSQTRKGLSQLYEYRFRYSDDIKGNVILCLVFPKEPNEIDWLEDYLCKDRDIAVAWFEGERLNYSPYCASKMSSLNI